MIGRAARSIGWLAVAALAAVGLLGPATAAAEDAKPGIGSVIDARVVGDAKRTRFVADLSGPVDMAVFTLGDPYRVVIDLPELHFQLPSAVGRESRGLVSAFRYGQISRGKSRIVLDMAGPVTIDKSFVLPAAAGQPSRLVIDVVPTTAEAFQASLRPRGKDPAPAAQSSVAGDAGPKSGKVRIVLDPGHGGIDSGAVGAQGTREKDVTLQFAQELAKILRKKDRYEVLLTREDDSFVRLRERVEFARRNHADLFVSLHADSFRGVGVRGATVYTLSERASDAMAAAIAEGENRSDIIAGVDIEEGADDVADILLDLARRETKNFSIVLARTIVNEMRPSIRLFKNPHQQAGFMVLKAPDIPSALVELGFLSNSEDEKLLKSPAWREKAATSIAGAIDAYFETRLARGAAP